MIRIALFAVVVLTASIAFDQIHLKGYTKEDGTYVRPHTRSSPGTKRTHSPESSSCYENRCTDPLSGVGNSYGSNPRLYQSEAPPNAPEPPPQPVLEIISKAKIEKTMTKGVQFRMEQATTGMPIAQYDLGMLKGNRRISSARELGDSLASTLSG